MQVSKWGDTLAIRLSESEIESQNLKEGEEINVIITRPLKVDASRQEVIEAAVAKIRSLQRPAPPGFRFDRLEANER